MPAWVAGFDDTEVTRIRELRHVQRDGEDYLLDVHLWGDPPFTALVYVDNNLGGVVKDAFLMAEPLDAVDELRGAAHRRDVDALVAAVEGHDIADVLQQVGTAWQVVVATDPARAARPPPGS